MSGKTKIVVLHKKELVCTIAFAVIGIVTIIALIALLGGCETNSADKENKMEEVPTTQGEAKETVSRNAGLYQAGIYHTIASLGESTMEMEVIINPDGISSVELKELTDSVSAMYPLVEPAMDALEKQLLASQDVKALTYSEESRYTSMMLLRTLEHTLQKAEAK